MNKKKIVLIGSHLSKQRGTKGPAENIATLLKKEYDMSLVSQKENQLFRLVDIVSTLIVKRFDIVHIDVFSNKAFIYADMAGRIAKMKKERVVMTLHGGMLTEKYEREPQRVHSVLERANVLQSPSLFLIEFFKKQGIDVAYMPNFINLSRFPYDRKEVKPYTLLWVRAFSPEYRPELAIKTLNELLNKYPEATLTMIGPDKGILGETKALVKELGISKHVVFEGKVPNERLFKYYQTHSVYLNTTAYESFGVAVFEAAACGIPVVSTKVGEIPYLWKDQEEILICEAKDIDMADSVMRLFQDGDFAMKLSTNARKKSETFSWKSIESKWHNLFDRLFATKEN